MTEPNAPARHRTRGARFLPLAAAAIAVILVGFFAAPLVYDFDAPAPQGGQQTVQQGLTATPADAVVDQEVAITGGGVEPGASFQVLGGIDQGQLRPIGEGQADGQGTVTARAQIPEWAERGKPFFFAVEANGRRIGTASVNVVVRSSG